MDTAINGKLKYNLPASLSIFKQITASLKYIDELNMGHLDVSLENFLVDEVIKECTIDCNDNHSNHGKCLKCDKSSVDHTDHKCADGGYSKYVVDYKCYMMDFGTARMYEKKTDEILDKIYIPDILNQNPGKLEINHIFKKLIT